MEADRLRPEVRKTIARLPRLPFNIRPLLPLARLMYNVACRSKPLPGVAIDSLGHGNIKLRVYTSESGPSGAAALWLYGGGHLAGKPAHLDRFASKVVLETGATVFVPTYRLAPKHPFPAGLEDALAAWSWMLENAGSLDIDIDRFALGGHSAGAGLAAALAQRILDAGGPQPKAQILFYPMLDDRTVADSALDPERHFIWDNKANRVAWSAFLAPRSPGADELPAYASPSRRTDLRGLPPAWIGQCGIDLFAQEDGSYAESLNTAGVRCELYRVDGVPHAFETILPDLKLSEAFEASAIAFLNDATMKGKSRLTEETSV